MTKRKFTIKGLESTHRLPNERMLIHGPEKVGKTTFVCSAPDVVALDVEGRMGHMDVQAWRITSWEDALDALDTILHEDHQFQNVVIDSLSFLERHLKSFIEKRNKWTPEEASDFARWNRLAKESYWPQFLLRLERLDRERQMGVLMTAHTVEKELRSLRGDPYHRYIPDLCGKSPEIFKHWAHFIGFASTSDMIVKAKEDGRTVVRTSSTGESVLYCRHTPRYDAGSSYGLPPSIPLDWDEYASIRSESWDRVQSLESEVEKLLEGKDKKLRVTVTNWIDQGNRSISRLEAAVARLRELDEESGDDENKE